MSRRSAVGRPRLEGTVAVRGGRRLGFAEFGRPDGEAVIWMHGTPGARRQIPLEARQYADREGLRIIGVDRPGIGSSRTCDLALMADVLGPARPGQGHRGDRRRADPRHPGS